MNNAVTKEDLKFLATKADIQRLEQDMERLEQDMKRFATKADVTGLRGEFKRTEKSLRGEILRVEEKVEVLEEGQQEIKASLVKLQNTLDGFVGTVDDLRTDNQVGAHQLIELDACVTKLESSRPAA